jgi:DNA polymerase (family 10)
VRSEADLEPLFAHPTNDADRAMLTRLRQIYEAGGWVLVESAVADLPADLRWLYESDAVTLPQLAAIHKAVGATSAADLAAAVAEHRIGPLADAGPEVEERIRAALPNLRALVPRIALGRAASLAEPFLTALRATPGVAWAEPTGSLRRGEDMVGDIDILAPAADPAPVVDAVARLPQTSRVLYRSERRVYVLSERAQIAVRIPEPAHAGAPQLYLTGSIGHIESLREHAEARGMALRPSGLVAGGSTIAGPTEDTIYRALGLPCIPVEIRHGDGEVAAAAHGALPTLVTRGDIRGDLHMHSTYSDGRDAVETMVEASRALGYEYIAITDHSQRSAASHNLTVDDVRRQADEIAALRQRFPTIAILHGCEVDILPDGRLDFVDQVLMRFDVVLASLHDAAGHGPDQLLKRYAAAMKHPLVSIITHPTNRMVPHRRGYDIDYDRLFEIAVETGTIIEVDGAPGHLDLDGALARRAIAAGATLVINSDCHRAELLDRQMGFGVTMARRGWVEPRHVVNTRPLEAVRDAIAAKRAH